MNAGELRETVELEKLTDEEDELGGTKANYLPLGGAGLNRRRAKVSTPTGTEAWRKQVNPELDYLVSMHWDQTAAELRSRDRILWKGRELEIVFVAEDPEKKSIVLDCKESAD